MNVNRFPSPSMALKAAVDSAGSQSALARLLGISQRAVWRWVSEGKHLPAEHVLKVELATGIPKEQLRPDLFRDEPTPTPTDSDILDRAVAHHDHAAAGSMEWKR